MRLTQSAIFGIISSIKGHDLSSSYYVLSKCREKISRIQEYLRGLQS